MFHVTAFEEAIDATANTELDHIPDQIINSEAGQAYFGRDLQLQAIYASAVTLIRGRVLSPKLREIFIPYIIPFGGTLLPDDDPNVMDLRNRPIRLRANERFSVELSDSAAGPNQSYAVMFLSDGPLSPAPQGELTTLRATGTTTLVTLTWVDVALTFDQQLKSGRYAIVGGQLQSATAIAWRLILDGGGFRPGGLGQAALTSRSHSMFYNGGLGSWGEFVNTSLPRLQVLANAGDIAQSLFLQVVRIGDT